MSPNIDYQIASTDLIVKDMGARLARVRLSRNISQEALAGKAGITRRTLSRLETGQGATLDALVRVLKGLDLESHLDALLPDPGIQPMQRSSATAAERKRARPKVEESAAPWHWDEDELP